MTSQISDVHHAVDGLEFAVHQSQSVDGAENIFEQLGGLGCARKRLGTGIILRMYSCHEFSCRHRGIKVANAMTLSNT